MRAKNNELHGFRKSIWGNLTKEETLDKVELDGGVRFGLVWTEEVTPSRGNELS